MSNNEREIFCSFCGKPKELTKRLIAGPNGIYICDECIEICRDVIKAEEERAEYEGVKLLNVSALNVYDLINHEQTEIKDEYNVDQVYPPKGFKIIRQTTYSEELQSVEKVYEDIKTKKQFRILIN